MPDYSLTRFMFLVHALLISFPLAAHRAAPSGVNVSYSLQQKHLSLHEPVVMQFSVQNQTSEIVKLDLGQDRKEGFLLAVEEPNGTKIRLPQLSHDGISKVGTFSIEPGQIFTQDLLLNEWYDFKAIGRYEIEARLANPIPIGRLGLVQDEGVTRQLLVDPRDPIRLEKICAELAKQTEIAATVEAAQFPGLALSRVEDPVAVPYLAQVMRGHTLAYDSAIHGLERIGNGPAIEVLLSALDDNYGGIAESATLALARMRYRITDAHLKDTVQGAVERSKARARTEFIQTQIAYLDYRNPDLQRTAMENLTQVEGGLQQAEAVLQRLVNDPNQAADVRAAAKDALQRLHPPN